MTNYYKYEVASPNDYSATVREFTSIKAAKSYARQIAQGTGDNGAVVIQLPPRVSHSQDAPPGSR